MVFAGLVLLEEDDGERLGRGGVAEEGDGLLGAVAVDIDELDGLTVVALERGDELGGALLCVDEALEGDIGLGGARQGVHLIDVAEDAAGERERDREHGGAQQGADAQ